MGNVATALGLIAAAKKAKLELFLGSYPITPASDILHELSKFKEFGVKTFQAEDEIAAITSAIGASYAGALAATTTSGPGLALKTEAMGLAVMLELPLVIVNVQRGGPSTGLPTKTEQADLLQAVVGRNGEAPMCVISASTPADCFEVAYEAARIAVKYMTPVICSHRRLPRQRCRTVAHPEREAISKRSRSRSQATRRPSSRTPAIRRRSPGRGRSPAHPDSNTASADSRSRTSRATSATIRTIIMI